jgi:hypothetical protein
MEGVMITLLILGPGVIAVASAAAAVWMFTSLDRTEKPASKVMLWIGITVCSLIAFGIGSCYAMVFTGGVH